MNIISRCSTYRTVIALDSKLIQVTKFSPKSRLPFWSSRRSLTVQNPKIICQMAKKRPCFVSCYHLFRRLTELCSLVWLPKQVILMTCWGKMRWALCTCANVECDRIMEKKSWTWPLISHCKSRSWKPMKGLNLQYNSFESWKNFNVLLLLRWPCKDSQLCTRPTSWNSFTVMWPPSRREGCMMCLFADLRLLHTLFRCFLGTFRKFGTRDCWSSWTNVGSIWRSV